MEQEELEGKSEELQEGEQATESKTEEVQKTEAKAEESGQSSDENTESSPDSGKYRALKRFFVRSPKGRRVVFVGEELTEDELQKENILDGLVERI